MLTPSKKGLLSPFSWARKGIYLGTHLKEELADLFLKVPGVFLILTESKEDDEQFADG